MRPIGNGNLTCVGSTSATQCTGSQSQAFTWDVRNRMSTAAVEAGVGSSPETYVYDGLSRRQSVGYTTTGNQASYLYDGLNPVNITTVNNGSTTDVNAIFAGLGLDERFKMSDSASGSTGSIVTDIQGSTVEITKAQSQAIAYSYPPFGGPGGAADYNPFRYTGREVSINTGLYYYRGRYYNPAWGRFVSEDPIGFAGGVNIYAYTNNDPINYVDPLGEDVTVTLYQGAGPFGHIGIGVTPPGFPVPPGQTFGFYPAPGYSPWGGLFGTQGVLSQDIGKTPISSITIPTTAAQDAQVSAYLANEYLNPGDYSLAAAGGATIVQLLLPEPCRRVVLARRCRLSRFK